MAGGGEAAARRALEKGLAHNSAGRPARASAAFRAALRHLDRDDPHGSSGPWGTDAERTEVRDRAPGRAEPAGAYLRSRALLGLVISEFELRADLGAGEDGLDDAERWARAAGVASLEVAIRGQRGLMRLRAGDVDGALAALDQAVAMIDVAEPVDACRVLLNRGSLLLELGRLEGARSDLRACAARAEAAGDALRMFKAMHNLGYLEYLAGDLPAALAAMTEAATADHGASPAVALLDRAQVLLEAGLVTEADHILAEAAQLFAGQRLAHDLAQVELTRAHCALLARRPADALRWARSARRRFVRRRNLPWTERAELAVSQAELATLLGERDRGDGGDEDDERARRAALTRLARRAQVLADEGGARSAWGGAVGTGRGPVDRGVERAARVTAAEAWAAAGRTDEAREALAHVGRLTGREPLALAIQVRLVRAQIALAQDGRARAGREVREGQRVLAQHRRQLGSVETVAAAAVHGVRLVGLDVGAALATGRADVVLDAVERGRATFAGAARVRPPEDPRLAELLSDLRQCLERRRGLAPDAGPATTAERVALNREAERLRQLVRDRSWQLGDGVEAPTPTSTRELRAALGARTDGLAVVDLVVHEGTVHAVLVDAAVPRLVRLAAVSDLAPLLRRVRADLEVLARPLPGDLADVARRSLRRGLARLDDLLLVPLGCDGPLDVVVGGPLLTVPWGALPSRAGRVTSVSPRVTLGQEWGHGLDGEVVAFAGPGLTHAHEEVTAIGRQWARARVLTGDAAVCAQARAALAEAPVVHLAAHGHHEVDNPLFSWVRLEDGPLFAHELEGLALPGSVVVLSACEVGRATERPGGEVLGLASVLLRLGASAVVAGLAPLRDDLAARVMPGLHTHLAAGRSPATALALACADVDEPVPVTCFTAGLG